MDRRARFKPDHAWRREDWNRPGHREEFLPWFKNWRFDWLDVPDGDPRRGPVFRIPDGRSRSGRALDLWPRDVVGRRGARDVSIGSNGASQAILDARVLAREIQASRRDAGRVTAYEAERRPATAGSCWPIAAMVPSRSCNLVQERAPDGYARIEDVLSREELEDAAAGYKAIAGFDKDALNARAPIVTPSRR